MSVGKSRRNMHDVIEATLKVRAMTLGKLWQFLKYAWKGSIFIFFASIVALIAFAIGSHIKEKEDDKYSRRFRNDQG